MSQIKWMKSIRARSPKQFIPHADLYKWNAFNRDYAQIVHSDFFKRLAGKTQVHSFPINDHLRTRLTHSVEVSQIGRQISRFFATKIKSSCNIDDSFFPEFMSRLEELTSSACLMHDTGHPPFGHEGAVLLNNLAKKYSEDFDDNKQSMRIILNSLWNEKFDPTGALAVSIMKKYEASGSAYKAEVPLLSENLQELGLTELRHPSSYFMEAADDLAYIASDLSDFLRYFIDSSQVEDFLQTPEVKELVKLSKLDNQFNPLKDDNLYQLLNNVFSSKGKRSEEAVFEFTSNLIKTGLWVIFKNLENFINENNNPLEINSVPQLLKLFISKYSYNGDLNLLYLKTNDFGKIFYDLKKAAYKKHILEVPHIGSQNLLAKKVLRDLFEHFEEIINSDYHKSDAFKLLPLDCKGYVIASHNGEKSARPARVVIDFISGMTDEYAVKLWESINRPHIFSRVS